MSLFGFTKNKESKERISQGSVDDISIINNTDYTIKIACVSNTGHVRKQNEDNFLIESHYMEKDHQSLEQPYYFEKDSHQQTVVAVFDGMGGENAGELASFVGAYELADLGAFQKLTDDYITRIVRELNERVFDAGVRGKYRQIGSTMSMIIFKNQSAHICNLGDSPIYLFRNGQLLLQSKLHTNAEALKKMGITNRKPGLTQFLGIDKEEFLVEPTIKHTWIQKNDLYLICSDGLTDMVPEEEIAKVLSGEYTVSEKIETLKNMALNNGGKDNVTIILAEVQ